MSYQGPFGRILPLPEDHDEEPEGVLGPVDETRSSSTMYTLPRPALEFGSDNRGFTDPLRYSSQRNAQSPTTWHSLDSPSGEQARAAGHEMLPSVRQLLDPVAQPLGSPTTSIAQQSPFQSTALPLGLSRIPEPPTHVTTRPLMPTFHSPQSPSVPQFTQQSAPPEHRFPDSHAPFAQPPTQGYVQNVTPILTPFPMPSGQATQNMYPSHDSLQPGVPAGYSQPRRPPDSIPNTFPPTQPGFYPTASVPPQVEVSTNYSLPVVNGGDFKHAEKSPENHVKPQPRVVRDDILPGEGPVWVYEDGSTVPKMIDGEPVIAEWGITKAGKPRKRLAIACTTCREKKIKCQPALPKCAQCDKFGRECHYATA